MNLSEFEKIIQANLLNQRVDMDTDLFMQKLFEPKKEKRRYVFFWWFSGLALVGAAVLFIGFPKTDSQENIPIPTGEVVEAQVDGKAKMESITSLLQSENLSETQTSQESTSFLNSKPSVVAKKRMPGFMDKASRNESIINQANEELKSLPVLISGDQLSSELLVQRGFIDEMGVLDNKKIEAFTKPKYKIRKKVECPSFAIRKKVGFFIQPEFGLSLPQKSLEQNIPDISPVTTYRKENEKSLEGIHAGLLAGCFIGKTSFYANTGIQYSRITEKLDLTYNYTRQDTSFGIISITKSQSGDTVTVIYGDIVTEKNVQGQKIRHHYFHTWDIPLTLGYQLALGSAWNMHIEGGVLFNFRLKTTGQVLHSLQDFQPVMKNEYHMSLGLGYKAALGVEYLIKPSIGIGMQARVLGYGKTFTSPNSNFQQKYIIPGANIYLRYYFSL